jgi:hypothetical protein
MHRRSETGRGSLRLSFPAGDDVAEAVHPIVRALEQPVAGFVGRRALDELGIFTTRFDVARGAGTDEGGIERLPLVTGAQHEENGVETAVVIGALPALTKRIRIDVPGNERRKAHSERVGNPPAIVFDFADTLARRHGRPASKGLMQGNRQDSGRDLRVFRISPKESSGVG